MISSITSKLTESPVKRLKAIETVNQHDIEGAESLSCKWDIKKKKKEQKQGVGAPCFCRVQTTEQENSLRTV